jgi:protein-disulfide isomerase-like protein with CxxC motif
MIEVIYFNDPACPWGYSVNPALRVIEWRYGDQLHWRLVVIGLTEDVSQYAARGYTPLRGALGQLRFRARYGMPFAPAPKQRLAATARACRAIVATRLLNPGSEFAAFRAIQLANFTTPLVLDDDRQLERVLIAVPGIDATAVIGMLDALEVTEAYERDRAEARTAAGSPTELQGKARVTDGPVRYTAPSLIFERDGVRLEAGGFQTVEAYDVLIVNLDPKLRRQPPPADPGPLLEYFPGGLTTQEVAALMAVGNHPPDRDGAERALMELLSVGGAVREPLGDDALWRAPAAVAAAGGAALQAVV